MVGGVERRFVQCMKRQLLLRKRKKKRERRFLQLCVVRLSRGTSRVCGLHRCWRGFVRRHRQRKRGCVGGQGKGLKHSRSIKESRRCSTAELQEQATRGLHRRCACNGGACFARHPVRWLHRGGILSGIAHTRISTLLSSDRGSNNGFVLYAAITNVVPL